MSVKKLIADFGAVGDGQVDDTQAFNNAASELNTNPSLSEVIIDAANFRITSVVDEVTRPGAVFSGEGMWNTTIINDGINGDLFTFSGHDSGIKKVGFTSAGKPTSGYAVKLTGGALRPFANEIFVKHGFNGILVESATQAVVEKPLMRYMFGTRGIKYTGAQNLRSYGLTIEKAEGNNPYPLGQPGTVKVWAVSTVYSVGDVILNSGNIYQCVQAGTSAASGTGPSGTPGSTAEEAFTNTITDNGVEWQYVSSGMYWLNFDSYAHSLRIDGSASLLNGYMGFLMSDSANTGSSYPTLFNAQNLECDHNWSDAALFSKGAHAQTDGGFFGSSLQGYGKVIDTSFLGGYRGNGIDSRGNWCGGVLLNGGQDNILNAGEIGDNSQAQNGLYHGVTVGGGVSYQTITSNTVSDLPDSGTNKQGYGIYIIGGTGRNLKVQNNNIHGNVTGAVYNGATGSNNNIQTS